MDVQPLLGAAAKAYRFSLFTLLVVLVLAAGVALLKGPAAGLATALGGLIVWLPHLFMIGKVFGVSRRGARAVTMGGLLVAEAIKLILVAALFAVALVNLPKANIAQLFLGFLVTLMANITGLALLSRAIDETTSNSRKR